MKPRLIPILIASALACVMPSCVESTVTTTDAKTGIVTVTRTKTPAPGSLELVGQGIAAVASRQNQK